MYVVISKSGTILQLYRKMTIISAFSLEKKGILISCQSRSVLRPSVRASVMFLVNVSPPKP